MNDEPLVSVIMNCYNGEKYLREAVDSVIEQGYKNWELIFWDNQSNDNSAEIFRSYEDKRLKYFLASTHTQLYEARVMAVEKSNGKYLAFLDIDDWWLPLKLEQQIPLFEDQSIGLVYSNFYWVNEVKNTKYIAYTDNLVSGDVLADILNKYVVGLLTIVVRRSAYEQLSYGFNPEYNIIGDFDLSIRLAMNWKFSVIQTATAYCRWHGNNMQFIQMEKQINELEKWAISTTNNETISKMSEFQLFKNNIIKMKAIYELRKGKYSYVFKNIFAIHGYLNKIKLIIATLLPVKVIRMITDKK